MLCFCSSLHYSLTGSVLRHMANVITRCVTWKDCIYTSCHMSFTSADGIFLCYESCCLPPNCLSNSQSFFIVIHLSASGFIHLSCHHSRLAGISHFSVTFCVNQIDHSLMLSCNFTLHSCSYRRPSICN